MRKLILFGFALFLGVGNAFAIQIDEGENMSSSKSVFFVGRYGRSNVIATNGQRISKDLVVIWDLTSNDGVSVNLSTQSFDASVAGVAIDDINGISSDATAANSLQNGIWGRIRVYGRHANVSFDAATACGIGNTGATLCPMVGLLASQSGVAGRATILRQTSDENALAFTTASRDSFGILLESPAVTDKTADILVKAM